MCNCICCRHLVKSIAPWNKPQLGHHLSLLEKEENGSSASVRSSVIAIIPRKMPNDTIQIALAESFGIRLTPLASSQGLPPNPPPTNARQESAWLYAQCCHGRTEPLLVRQHVRQTWAGWDPLPATCEANGARGWCAHEVQPVEGEA